MGQTAQSGQVVFATQTAYGVPLTETELEADGISVKIRSGTLGGQRDLLTPEAEIGGGRDTSDAYMGAVTFSGDFDLYVRFRAVAFFLANALGVKASLAAGTGAWTHTITPADGQVPFMSVHETLGDGMERFLYSDVVVNTLHFEADANGYLSMTVGLIARNGEAGADAIDGTATLDNTSMVVGTNIKIRYNNELMPAKSFSVDVNNNFEDDNHYLGSFFLGDLTAKSREVTASATVRHETAKYMKQALFGTQTSTTIGGLTTKEKLEVICEAYEDVPGATPAIKYSLTLEFPKLIFEPFAFEVQGDDAFENDISMRAVRPNPATPVMTAKVVNGQATIE